MRTLRNPLIWTSLSHLLTCFGIIYILSFFASCHWYFYAFGLPFLGAGWYVVYCLERGLILRFSRPVVEVRQ